jgi:uroporphyrinogen-III decarboxylase
MKKGVKNDITNNDGRPVLEIKTLADIEQLKEYKEKQINVRIIIQPKNCTDPYPELVKAMTDLLGVPEKIGIGSFKKEIKN